eukprot:s309_g3.t1
MGPELIGKFVEHLIDQRCGFKTPQAFLYSLEYFSVIFGYDLPRISVRRWKRMADDYSAKAPPRIGAPHLDPQVVAYLESMVLDDERPMFERITAGKLRLCIQGSLRHSDLTSTPLRSLEWCRFRGTCHTIGVRATAPRTKSGPRAWAASLLGITPDGDGWLTKLVELVISSHGKSWRLHSFFGCAPDGASFFQYPSCIATDTEIIRAALVRDIEEGRAPSSFNLTVDQACVLRWHGAKATLTTYMTHLSLPTKVIRLQGGWKKSNEMMTDLYLRESQSFVLQGQIKALNMLRKGAALKILVGDSIDSLPSKLQVLESGESGDLGVSFSDRDLPSFSQEEISQAMERCGGRSEAAVAAGELPLSPELCPDEKAAWDPATEISSPDEPPEEGDTESEAESDSPDVTDVELYDYFVMLRSGSGRIHKPSASVMEVPKCGNPSRNFTRLELRESWGEKYDLCSRCFGKADGGCSSMCSFTTTTTEGREVRCGRRCAVEQGAHAGGVAAHFCALHGGDMKDDK